MNDFLPRAVTPLLLAAFLLGELPSPALALRPLNAGGEESPVRERLQAGLEEEAEIPGPDGPIRLKLPEAVKEAIDLLGSEIPPAEQVAQRIRQAWSEAEAEDLDAGTALFLESPEIFFWIPENFSNPNLDLTDSERALLSGQIQYELFNPPSMSLSSLGIFSVLESQDLGLEGWWYLLVRLLVLEQRLEQASPVTRRIEEHLDLVRMLYRVALAEFFLGFTSGWLSLDPKDYYEKRLIELSRVQPALRPVIGRLLQNWEAWTPKDMDEVWALELSLMSTEEEPDSFEPPSSAEVVKEAEEGKKLALKLLLLQNVVTPRSEETQKAWDYPIRTLVERAASSDTLFLRSTISIDDRFKKDALPNGWLFQLDLIDHLADSGFKRWALTDSENYSEAIQRWAMSLGDRRPLQEFIRLIQEYLEGPGAVSLRTFLALPKEQEPPSVTVSLKFWEEIWRLRRRHHAEVKLFLGLPLLQEASFQQWMRQGEGKRIILAEWSSLSLWSGYLHGQKVLIVDQSPALEQYRYILHPFIFSRAVRYVSYRIGESRGWGDHRSAGIPMRGNESFPQLFERGDDLWSWKDRSSWMDEYRDRVDFLVVSAESDEGEQEEPWVPETEDAGVPAAPRELVPVGPAAPAAGLEERPFLAMGAGEFRARFPQIDVPRDAKRVFLLPGDVTTQIQIYADPTLLSGLEERSARERSSLPENIQVRVRPVPPAAASLERPGAVLWHWLIGPLYEQRILPEAELDNARPMPRLISIVLLALQGPGAKLEEVVGALTFQDAQGRFWHALFA
ncbi:MAG: hypothetical protein HYZ93_02835 [Candidatus Omnitrophica bacterium]|nr:hypothetical protein [Candidatus Omnitrophota bacterium]